MNKISHLIERVNCIELTLNELLTEKRDIELVCKRYADIELDDKYEYQPFGSWWKKAEFILKSNGKAMSSSQIVDEILINFEPFLNRKKALRCMAAILTNKSANGTFERTYNDFEKVLYYDLKVLENEH